MIDTPPADSDPHPPEESPAQFADEGQRESGNRQVHDQRATTTNALSWKGVLPATAGKDQRERSNRPVQNQHATTATALSWNGALPTIQKDMTSNAPPRDKPSR
jgi:hypothetical protein